MYDTCLMKGTTLAVDGIVIETTQPLLNKCEGDIYGNMNRQG